MAVQPEKADTLVSAYRNGEQTYRLVENPASVASAVSIDKPLDWFKLLRALRESKGSGLLVNDAEILEAEKLLAKKESVFVEPASATVVAGLIRGLKEGTVDPDERVVLVLTGTGLKDHKTILKVLPSPPSVNPVMEEVTHFLDYGYYDIHADPVNVNKALFAELPTREKLAAALHQEFNLSLDGADSRRVLGLVEEFLGKGKTITKSDLKYILRTVLKKDEQEKKHLDVLDFKVETNKNHRATAYARVRFLDQVTDVDAEGVGPVDAVLKAVRQATESGGFKCELGDYAVHIDSGGTNAAVRVRIELSSGSNTAHAEATSPDIIVASVKAFEDGFNQLYEKGKR